MKKGRETTLEERIQIVRECIAYGKNYIVFVNTVLKDSVMGGHNNYRIPKVSAIL